MGRLRSRTDHNGYRRSKAEGAARASEKIVGLHPGALREYEEQVSQLQGAFGQGISPDNAEAANNIRDLICRVTLYPSEPGFRLELQGRLARLMEAPRVYPNMRIAASGGLVVAEEGLALLTQAKSLKNKQMSCNSVYLDNVAHLQRWDHGVKVAAYLTSFPPVENRVA